MDKPQMTFWFEFASTYSYLSAMRVQEAADNAGVVVLWQPFLLGPVFGAQGWTTSPFNVYPRKGAYMWRDMARLAAERGLEFRQPEVFPQNGILAARVTLALRAAGHAGAP
jgi:2-hydroxychromene-2-carboxylate isomerase